MPIHHSITGERKSHRAIKHAARESRRGFGAAPGSRTRELTRGVRLHRRFEARQESESAFRSLSDSGIIGISFFDEQGRAGSANEKFLSMTGFSREELKSEAFLWERLTPPEWMARTRKAIEEFKETGRIVPYEKEYFRKDGSKFWCVVGGAKFKGRPGGIGFILDITDRKLLEEAVRENEERLRLASMAANFGTYDIYLDTGEVFLSPELKALFGLPSDSPSTLPLKEGLKFVHPDDFDQVNKVLTLSMDPASGGKFHQEHRIVRADGSVVWVNMLGETFFKGEGENRRAIRTTGVLMDITERKRAEDALRESENRFRTLADNIAQLAWMADEKGEVFWYNERWFDFTGASPEEMRTGGWEKFHRPDHVKKVVEGLGRSFQTGESWEGTLPLRGADGKYRWFLSRAIPIKNEGGRVIRWFATCTDITERKKMEEDMKRMAQHDALTGLPNRRLFSEIISVDVARSRRRLTKLAVFFLDLDRFKEINDTLGHETGDKLLKQAATRLTRSVRVSDTVARMGGDEFNLILPDIDRPEYASEVAQKVLNEIRKPFSIEGRELNISTSIGISIYPDDSRDIQTLLRFADIAMYHAKEKGRDNYQFYNPIINTRSLERMELENRLRQAIERGEFVLYFQPLVDVKTGKTVCAEALLRWHHPEKGLLGPHDFFTAAEDIGLMPEIDEWVLTEAIRQVKFWLDQGIPCVSVTVNLSTRKFQEPDLVNRIAQVLEEARVPPECLEIEITETTLLTDIENTVERLNRLARLGVKVAIDNFGTGFSSLNHLKRLPIGKLKIDKSFVEDIAKHSEDRAVISAVLLMAHTMKIKVVAAGVEEMSQLAFLRALHCDEAQGYLFGRPVGAEEFTRRVKQA